MESEASSKILTVIKKNWIAVILAGLGLIFFMYGMISFLSTNGKTSDIKFETNSSLNTSPNLIAIDIEGEVVKPGVYKLKENSIVQDALVASGGLTALADRDWISKNLNLAVKISDGQKIYIPKQGEALSGTTLGVLDSSSISNLININTASESELDTLSGIGPVTAGKIIGQRPYGTIDDLLSKKVVSQKVFDQIKDKIIAQ